MAYKGAIPGGLGIGGAGLRALGKAPRPKPAKMVRFTNKTGGKSYRPLREGETPQKPIEKSAWGIVHKLDQSDVHVDSTMTGPKKARRRRLKRIVVT